MRIIVPLTLAFILLGGNELVDEQLMPFLAANTMWIPYTIATVCAVQFVMVVVALVCIIGDAIRSRQ